MAGFARGPEAKAGLAVGAFDAFGLFAVEGSTASQTFSAQAGSIFSFAWNFGTRETALDYAFVVIDGVLNTLNRAVNPAAPSSANDLFQTGWRSFSSGFAQSGLRTVTFGVVDLTDNAARTSLSIDQVQVSAVPEADVRLMLLAGLAAMAFVTRRLKGG